MLIPRPLWFIRRPACRPSNYAILQSLRSFVGTLYEVEPMPGMPTVQSHLTTSGRVALKILKKVKLMGSAARFSEFLCQRPVLVGAAIKGINLEERVDEEEANETFMLIQENAEADDETPGLHNAIYPLVKDSNASKANVFTIGRGYDNDLVMVDFAVSKRHAIIEIKPEGYLLRDHRSTNGTMVNHTKVTDEPQLLRDKDVITFARYEFIILTPKSLYSRLA
ncbi:FHA domain-containing protein [Rhabdochromatium marinum]|uniref:FHA domain-containing protein n=1 Tax=Rhabdochromatium marinum TaxID=48729 RepID=UPI001A939D64